MKKSRDTPLFELTLRRYEKPDSLTARELVRKFCLSLGLLQPGDSRDIIVDILYALLLAKQQKQELTCEQIRDHVVALRKKNNLELFGIATSNVRRQIKRMREVLLVEKRKNYYRITEFAQLGDIYKQKLEQLLLPSVLSRLDEYFKMMDKTFS